MNKETKDKLKGFAIGLFLGIGIMYGSIMLIKNFFVLLAKAFLI